MSTETNQDESSQPPFQFGDVVRHQSGDVIKVEACKRVVAHSHLRWAVYDANGNRFWARNCGLVERPRATLGGGTADGERPIAFTLTKADLVKGVRESNASRHGPHYESGEPIETNDVVTVGNGSRAHTVRSYTHDHEWLIKVSGVGGVYRPNELTLVEKLKPAEPTVAEAVIIFSLLTYRRRSFDAFSSIAPEVATHLPRRSRRKSISNLARSRSFRLVNATRPAKS